MGSEKTGYQSKEFWEKRLGHHPDLSGTGEPGLSIAYNQACYRLREIVLERELQGNGFGDLAGKRVLDVGSGVGFFVDFYTRRGADVTGVELTEVGAKLLRDRFPRAHFFHGDIVELEVGTGYDVVNAFDVLYHIVEEDRWEAAVRRLGQALAPGGLLLLTDVLSPVRARLAAHNVMRDRDRYTEILKSANVRVLWDRPTHYLLNRDLGVFKGLNRMPSLLYGIDRFLLAISAPSPEPANRLLVARQTGF